MSCGIVPGQRIDARAEVPSLSIGRAGPNDLRQASARAFHASVMARPGTSPAHAEWTMSNKVLVGMLAVAIACAIAASGYAFGRYLAKATGKVPAAATDTARPA